MRFQRAMRFQPKQGRYTATGVAKIGWLGTRSGFVHELVARVKMLEQLE